TARVGAEAGRASAAGDLDRRPVPSRPPPAHLRAAAPPRRDAVGGRPMTLEHALKEDEGNAILEFVVLSAALLIPSLYLVLTLGNVQAAVFAADTISRDAARIHAAEPDPERAAQRAAQHTAMVREDHALAREAVVTLSCSEGPR